MIVGPLLNFDVEADSKDSSGLMPLFWAAWGMRGHEVVVKPLVKRHNVKADSKAGSGREAATIFKG